MGDEDVPEESLLARLPTVYSVALRLHAAGATDVTIAAALGVAVESVPGLVEVGRLKLRELHDLYSGAGGPEDDRGR